MEFKFATGDYAYIKLSPNTRWKPWSTSRTLWRCIATCPFLLMLHTHLHPIIFRSVGRSTNFQVPMLSKDLSFRVSHFPMITFEAINSLIVHWWTFKSCIACSDVILGLFELLVRSLLILSEYHIIAMESLVGSDAFQFLRSNSVSSYPPLGTTWRLCGTTKVCWLSAYSTSSAH